MSQIYISGGSNSVLREGWVMHFRAMRSYADAVNISVGASGSAMGAFRTMFTADIRSGDSLVWEYALNDGLLVNKRHSIEYCLRHLEYVLIHCRERGANFYPLVFRNRAQEQDGEAADYFERLKDLFDCYGLRYLDVSAVAREKLNVPVLPSSCYLDRNHYNTGSKIVEFIAHFASKLVESGDNKPIARPAVYVKDDAGLAFESSLLEPAKPGRFSNRLIDIAAYEGGTMPWQTAPIKHEGVVSAMLLMCPENGGSFRLRNGRQTTHAHSQGRGDGEKLILRMVAIHDLSPNGFSVMPGDTISIEMIARAGPDQQAAEERLPYLSKIARFVGLLIEAKGAIYAPVENSSLEKAMENQNKQADENQQSRQRMIYLRLRIQELKKEQEAVKAELDSITSAG